MCLLQIQYVKISECFSPLTAHCTASKFSSAVPVHSLSYAFCFCLCHCYLFLPCLSYPQLKIYAVLGVENIFWNCSEKTCAHFVVDVGSVFVDVHNFSRTHPHVSSQHHTLWPFVQKHYLHPAQENGSEVVELFFYRFDAVFCTSIIGRCGRRIRSIRISGMLKHA